MDKNLISNLRAMAIAEILDDVCDNPDCIDCKWYRVLTMAADEIEHLQRMTLLMAGTISTIGRWAEMDPQAVYNEFYNSQ